MNIFGLSITRTRTKAAVPAMSPSSWGWHSIMEPFAGAWQRNIVVSRTEALAYGPVFTCVTRIAGDIGKLEPKLEERDADGIWEETVSPAFTPVLTKPNHYQNRIKFFQAWVLSKLIHGNAYVLKERDNRGVVIALYVLDPCRCRPLVAPDGQVFYQIGGDDLSGIGTSGTVVPASEIIHDVMWALFHPLCGVSPLFAANLVASQGLAIQKHSTRFFVNAARPSGILTAPGLINQPTADRIKEQWEKNYGGENTGRVAVLGDGLKFESMAMTAEAAQMIEQLKYTAEQVAGIFHVPAYKIGAGPMPAYGNIEGAKQTYYEDCLQELIECIELCLNEGLGLTTTPGRWLRVQFDLDGLLRMDTKTKMEVVAAGVGAAVFAPNEGRKKFDLKPKKGGDSPYLQQQNYSLEALAKRDALADPWMHGSPERKPALPAPGPGDVGDEPVDKDFAEFVMARELSALPMIQGIGIEHRAG